jgi:hypothetical protein
VWDRISIQTKPEKMDEKQFRKELGRKLFAKMTEGVPPDIVEVLLEQRKEES